MRKTLHYIGSFCRGLALVVLASLVSLVVILGVLLSSVTMNVTSADRVKSWVVTRPVYEHAAEAFLALEEQDFGDEAGPAEGEETFLDEDTRDKLLEEFFTFEFYQRAGHEIIDGFYGWLGGETEEPEFEVVLTEDREDLVELLAIFFGSKIEGLPECPPGYAIPEDESILGSHCRPAGFDPNDTGVILAAAGEDEQLNQLLESATIDSDNIDFGEVEDPELLQRAFKAAQWTVWLALGALVLLGLLTVLVAYSWRRGLKIVSLTVLPLSILFLIGAGIAWWQRPVVEASFYSLASQDTNQAFGALAAEVTGSAVRDIVLTMLMLAGGLLITSILILTAPKWRPKVKAFWESRKSH